MIAFKNFLTLGFPESADDSIFENPEPDLVLEQNSHRVSSAQPGPKGCQSLMPVSIPDLFQINSSSTTAELFFTPLSDTNQYFISFSENPSAEQHGAQVTLSSLGVQKLTVNFLKPQTTYYFKVRGQNECMPGDWSQTMMVKTTNSNWINKNFYFY